MAIKGLIVDDCPEARALLGALLASLGVEALYAENLAEARRACRLARPALVLVDVELRGEFGYELLDPAEALSPVVIFVSANADLATQEIAFALGADDFVAKPFDPRALRMRLAARLKKTARPAGPGRLRCGPLSLNVETHEACLAAGERTCPLHLTPRQFQLLAYFARHAGRVMPRARILEDLWPGEYVSDRVIDAHVAAIRRELGAAATLLEAVAGVGYRMKDAA